MRHPERPDRDASAEAGRDPDHAEELGPSPLEKYE